jgi:hypothetical protein
MMAPQAGNAAQPSAATQPTDFEQQQTGLAEAEISTQPMCMFDHEK